jgi:hypothetical protein
MAMRSKQALAGGLGLAAVMACAVTACSPTPNRLYAGPGWYLEKPLQLFPAGPQIYAGPFTYEQCEAERTKLPESTAVRMLCFKHLTAPGSFGPYVTDWDIRQGNVPPVGPNPDTVRAQDEQRVSAGPRP